MNKFRGCDLVNSNDILYIPTDYSADNITMSVMANLYEYHREKFKEVPKIIAGSREQLQRYDDLLIKPDELKDLMERRKKQLKINEHSLD